jgi:hypothetical protein
MSVDGDTLLESYSIVVTLTSLLHEKQSCRSESEFVLIREQVVVHKSVNSSVEGASFVA